MLIFRFARPAKLGFHCDDQSINYPFKEDTVPGSKLMLYGMGIPNMMVSLNFIGFKEFVISLN